MDLGGIASKSLPRPCIAAVNDVEEHEKEQQQQTRQEQTKQSEKQKQTKRKQKRDMRKKINQEKNRHILDMIKHAHLTHTQYTTDNNHTFI